MKRHHMYRLVFAVAALLLLSVYFYPIWQIKLYAPQYPDGVDMYIYADKIGGRTPGTLQNMNILNHYIGMRPIEPDSIPELKIIKPVLTVFAIVGVFIAFFDKKWMYITWVVLLVITLLVGFYDFYLWEYNYGHNLDPNAPMQFEGASFQPPLIGKKQIINFTVYSVPHIGGVLIMISVLLAMVATYFKIKSTQSSETPQTST